MKEMPERIYLFDFNEAMTTPLEGDTEYIHREARIAELKNAIYRHITDYWPVPIEIVEGYNELVKDLEEEDET